MGDDILGVVINDPTIDIWYDCGGCDITVVPDTQVPEQEILHNVVEEE